MDAQPGDSKDPTDRDATMADWARERSGGEDVEEGGPAVSGAAPEEDAEGPFDTPGGGAPLRDTQGAPGSGIAESDPATGL